MDDSSSPFKLDSDPPSAGDVSNTSFKTPSKTTNPFLRTSSEHGSSTSVVSDIVSNRQQKTDNPNKFTTLLSPLSHTSHIDEQSRKLREMRSTRNNDKTMQRRGGLDNMAYFVMKGERAIEVESLKHDADVNTIPPDLAENLEKEQNEEMELYDEDLIEFIENKEVWERELEQMMSDFTVT